MREKIIAFIEGFKSKGGGDGPDEAATKQGIILPIVHHLGWDIFNTAEVTPEFPVENGRVDYALRLNNALHVFIEVKKAGVDLENHQKQLLEYSFHHGVELAALTNGITWLFYLPLKKGSWKERKFYTIDIVEQESDDVASKFVELLSKDNVQSGKAKENAESIFEGQQKEKIIENTLPETWNKIITEPDSLLVDLVAEITEKICGFKPDIERVKRFLGDYEAGFLISPESVDEGPKPPKPPFPSPTDKKISQDELIPYIVEILRKHGGKARKDEVEKEIYQKFHDIFQHLWYQEPVAGGMPRWQHNLAWARMRAKKKGLIKGPEESGRGQWELTPEAMKVTR